MAEVEIRDLHKRFGSVNAVNGLSFDVAPGRVTGFLGPNGAGKSTTLRALLGLIRPTSGTATFGGSRYEDLERPSTHVGAVLEDASFHPGRSARNHLRVLAVTGEHPMGRVEEVLDAVGLTDAADRRVKGYSMGMRQRLAIAAARTTCRCTRRGRSAASARSRASLAACSRRGRTRAGCRATPSAAERQIPGIGRGAVIMARYG